MNVKTLLRTLGIGAVATGLLALPGAWIVDRAAGRDLLVVEAHAADVVDTNRGMWELEGGGREGVPSIYGTPRGVERLLFVPPGKIVSPPEDPGSTLYLKAAGDHPFQAQTLWYFGVPTAIGALLVGAGLLFAAKRCQTPVGCGGGDSPEA